LQPATYPPSCYDHQMCLKPPLLLWVAVVYLSRALTMPIAMAIGHFAGVDARATTQLRALWSVDGLLPSLLAALVLYALCRRVPSASGAVRWIWAHGRLILAAAAALDVALLSVSLLGHGDFNDQSFAPLLAGIVDLYFLAYILMAQRVRDAFSEFPDPVEPPTLAGR
jgi:hypothetical protein